MPFRNKLVTMVENIKRIEGYIMNLIAAVDSNWAIGNKNKLLVKIPMDQKFFAQETTGKVVVMGRKTLESFPNGQPLINRTNINEQHTITLNFLCCLINSISSPLKQLD